MGRTALQITLALERYDRHLPFFDGTIDTAGPAKLNVLQVGQVFPLRHGIGRHERMILGREFDVAEFSMSSYLMAIDRGLPLTAIPVFPRRLFSPGQFYVHARSNLRTAADLAGRRVFLNAFQTTLSLLARGDLATYYGVPWERITWCVIAVEKVAFEPKPGVRIERLPADADPGLLLESGAVDAVIIPHPPPSMTSGRVAVRRLFDDPEAEELAYYKARGFYPIMHVVALDKELAARERWLPPALMQTFAAARTEAIACWEDPNFSRLAWGRRYLEREREQFGGDPWPDGLAANRASIEQHIAYSLDQQLIKTPLKPEDLFHPSTWTT